MKAIKENSSKMTSDVIEHIRNLIGDKVREEDGDFIVKPANNEELAKAVASIMAHGGAVSPMCRRDSHAAGDFIVDMSDMASIIDIDTVAMTAKVQVGCKINTLEAALEDEGFTLGSIPAGEDPTVEDWIYTEEPGIGSYKFGTVKDNIYNVIAVDAGGNIIETGYDKIGYYMSGYNLTQTYVASYGRVGIISEVTLKFYPAGIAKASAWDLPDSAALQDVIQKVGQMESAKPLHISFNGNRTLMAFNGAEAFVDLDMKQVDQIMMDAGAVRVPQADAEATWMGINTCDCVCPTALTMFVPLCNFAAFKDEASKIAGFTKITGNIPDRYTAVVKFYGESNEDAYQAVSDIAEKYGGRSSIRCPSKYRDEGTNAFVDKIESGMLLGEVEDVTLTRTVTPEIIEKLKEIVGKGNVNTSDMDRILYSHDLAPLPKEAGIAFKNVPDVIVRPETVEQISKVMALAYKHGIAVTPRGNATWGLGGSMPTNAGILLDMSSKMNKVLEINKEKMYVKVQAGCTWKNLLEACMHEGYIIGSYPSSFPSGTIGAWISTNGMGIGSYKYGSAKDNVINSQVVAGDGTIVTTGFDDVGSYRMSYNLNQFFSGAEGTLGMVATVTFRIYKMGEIRCLAYEFDQMRDANQPIQDLVRDPSVRPLHIAWSDYKHFENQRRAGVHAPDVSNLWLVTLQGDAEHNDLEEAAVDAWAENAGGRKVAGEIAEHEWEERCYEFRARKLGVGEIPAEVIVPVQHWGEFTDVSYHGFDDMKMEIGGIIGVMVDRSTTLFMPYYFKDDELLTGMLAFGFNFYLGDRAAEYGGRSTGLGVFFAWMLDVIHNSATSGMMRALKSNVDPHDVVNPGHVVCGTTRFGINLDKGIMSLGSALMQTIKKIMPRDRTFSYNLKRFRYDDLEHIKVLDRVHTLGDGTQ